MNLEARRAGRVGDVLRRLVLSMLRRYQRDLSPIAGALGAQCRFAPSCSQYMIDAVESRGVVAGLGLGLWRLVRCNPLHAGGYDPAPSGPKRRSTGQDVSRETV